MDTVALRATLCFTHLTHFFTRCPPRSCAYKYTSNLSTPRISLLDATKLNHTYTYRRRWSYILGKYIHPSIHPFILHLCNPCNVLYSYSFFIVIPPTRPHFTTLNLPVNSGIFTSSTRTTNIQIISAFFSSTAMRFNGAVLGAAVGLVGNRGGGSSRGGGGGPRECSAFSVMPSAPTGTPRGHTATRVVASAGFRFRPSRRSATTTTRISTRALSLSSSSQKRCRAYPSRPSKDSTDPGQSRRRRRGLIGVWPLFHGPHGHDDHTHGPELELELPAGGLVDLQVVGAGGATQTVRAVEAAESSTASHGGHSHGGGAHGHSHAHFHLDVSSLKTRPTLIRCVMFYRFGSGVEEGGGNIYIYIRVAYEIKVTFVSAPHDIRYSISLILVRI